MANYHVLEIKSAKREQFIDITDDIRLLINKSKAAEGVCHIYVPHTTAGVTINEGHDPSVIYDILTHLNKLIPNSGGYTHLEGNSDAHIKTFLAGTGKTVLLSGGKPLLGTWQRIFFCEFDGPRKRKLFIKIISD
ncbi:secondary thiamine-phosphate synthase enzyme YjbQ [Desulfoscipio sp. XC116]|uniref:secondary thiamine-phosphate synthase enzyme YjbQ n=1 Tax=Desulfoscipio sp. XC116 TaxID=3144975 RepID=UPI00325B7E08